MPTLLEGIRGGDNGDILDFLMGEVPSSQQKFRMSPLFCLVVIIWEAIATFDFYTAPRERRIHL